MTYMRRDAVVLGGERLVGLAVFDTRVFFTLRVVVSLV